MPKGKKVGGRVKGTPNKKTAEQLDRAERILQLIEAQYLENDLKVISSAQRMAVYSDMLEYRAPKLTRIDHTVKMNVNLSEEPITFE